MNPNFELKRLPDLLSVIIVNAVTQWYVAAFGILTVVTHLAQIASVAFVYYAYLTFGLLIVISIAIACLMWRNISKARTRDWASLAVVTAAGVFAGFLVTHLQPISPFGQHNDDYYFLANAVYYIHYPNEPLGFIVHSLYSGGEPFVSVSFLTTGAYQYIQAAIAHVLNLDYLTFTYLVVSPVSGFMFALALYLLLIRFVKGTAEAALGVFATLMLLTLLGERSIAPGVWVFSRIVQGKSIVVSAGACLFTHWSLDFLERRRRVAWLLLAALCTALIGMSSTAIMILPVLAILVFVSHLFAFYDKPVFSADVLWLGATYISALVYIFAGAVVIYFMDSSEAATYINRVYPDSFWGYAGMFFNSNIPITPMALTLFSIGAIILSSGRARRFVLAQIFLPFLILNPWVSDLLIRVYRGVYFRMFYIFPLFFVMGLTVSLLLPRLQSAVRLARIAVYGGFLAMLVVCIFMFPNLVFAKLDSYREKMSGPNYEIALKTIGSVPPGVVLAPYPISSTIFIFNPAYPQLLVKQDSTEYLPWTQYRLDEVQWRAQTQNFLVGNPGKKRENYAAFQKIIEEYPEVRAVIFSEELLAKMDGLENYMRLNGYMNFSLINGYVIAKR